MLVLPNRPVFSEVGNSSMVFRSSSCSFRFSDETVEKLTSLEISIPQSDILTPNLTQKSIPRISVLGRLSTQRTGKTKFLSLYVIGM